MFTFKFVAFGASIETRLELDGTTLLHCGNMPRIYESMKLVPRKMLTDNLSAMRHNAFAN